MKHFKVLTILVCIVLSLSLSACSTVVTPTLPQNATSSVVPTQSGSPGLTSSGAPTSQITSASTESTSMTPTATVSGSLAPTVTTDPTSKPIPTATTTPTSTPIPTATPTPSPRVGDIMTFGTYEQDNNLSNGKEPIAWRVLEVSGGKALLISDKNLDAKSYNTTYSSVTWATCTLRSWLNADFISVAFSTSEALSISLTTVTNPDNSYNGSPGCADTSDKVFLLSIDEAINYFSPNSSRIGLNTTYAVAQGAYDHSGAGLWWLRSPGYGPYNNESCVYTNGTLYVGYYEGIFYSAAFDVDVVNAVRPALWLNLGT